MTTIRDNSLFVLQDSGNNYNYTGAELKADISTVAAGVPGTGGDDLWLAVGSNNLRPKDPNTGIDLTGLMKTSGNAEVSGLLQCTDLQVNRYLNVIQDTETNVLRVDTTASVGTNLTVNGAASVGSDLTVSNTASVGTNLTVNDNVSVGEQLYVTGVGVFGSDITVAGNATVSGYVASGGAGIFGQTADASGKNGTFVITENGNVEHKAWIETKGLIIDIADANDIGGIPSNGGIKCAQTYAQTNIGATFRAMRVNPDGYYGCDGTFRRSAATNIQQIDTTNFIAALKAVNLHRSDQAVDASSSYDGSTSVTSVGLFIEDVEATNASSFLVSSDNQGSFLNDQAYSHFLFGVCKEQQQLIENLTTRIEQLEADHASAMNNMEDSRTRFKSMYDSCARRF